MDASLVLLDLCSRHKLAFMLTKGSVLPFAEGAGCDYVLLMLGSEPKGYMGLSMLRMGPCSSVDVNNRTLAHA